MNTILKTFFWTNKFSFVWPAINPEKSLKIEKYNLKENEILENKKFKYDCITERVIATKNKFRLNVIKKCMSKITLFSSKI